jgi:SNF2 family DNA or RNA helicase
MLQAEDRVHRIGQANACNIHYVLAQHTCDDYMWPSLVKKLRVVSP